MPATPGTYNVRFFLNNSWAKLATSATITVTPPPPPTITLSTTTIVPGGTVTATIVNGPGNAGDWLGLIGASAADGTYVAWKYLNGMQTRPARRGHRCGGHVHDAGDAGDLQREVLPE